MKIRNRVTELLGVDVPIVQAPMGWIARAQLASAVSNAGGMGIIETSSGGSRRSATRSARCATSPTSRSASTSRRSSSATPAIVDFVVEQGVKFVTTSAGDPAKYCARLKAGGAHGLPRRARRCAAP